MGRSSYFSLFGPVYVSHFSCLWLHKITQKVSGVYLYCLCDFQINWEAVLFEFCFHTSDWRLNVWSHSTRAENSSVMSSVSMMSRTCHVSRGCHAEVTQRSRDHLFQFVPRHWESNIPPQVLNSAEISHLWCHCPGFWLVTQTQFSHLISFFSVTGLQSWRADVGSSFSAIWNANSR